MEPIEVAHVRAHQHSSDPSRELEMRFVGCASHPERIAGLDLDAQPPKPGDRRLHRNVVVNV
jgi:hypothetical protein